LFVLEEKMAISLFTRFPDLLRGVALCATMLFFVDCGGGTDTTVKRDDNSNHTLNTKTLSELCPDLNATPPSAGVMTSEMTKLVGTWSGSGSYMDINLTLKKDGTYTYRSSLGIGKYHNFSRTINYSGKWDLSAGHSQIRLYLELSMAPLILTNAFPKIKTPAGVTLTPGKEVDTQATMSIDAQQDTLPTIDTTCSEQILSRSVDDFKVDYFTMVAPKVNSEKFWASAGIRPPGYNYGRKLGLGSAEWKYANKRIVEEPQEYTMVINDESWQTMFGNRKSYKTVIQDSAKLYLWFKYFKDEMILLGNVKGTVLYIIAGDAPPYWAGDIRKNYKGDPAKIPAKVKESLFPEVLERQPGNNWAGVFQMMDYLRMKYAPNVKLAYTLKTWGLGGINPFLDEPSDGWDKSAGVKSLAAYLNNYHVQFDMLAFNFNPRSKGSTPVGQYNTAVRFYAAISKQMKTRDGFTPKVWIWKVSLWNKEHTTFYFQNIRYLVEQGNAIGMTLGHGNDLAKTSGFSNDPNKDIYIKSWIREYYTGTKDTKIPVHATQGVVRWR
jgi:hypothetical protein